MEKHIPLRWHFGKEVPLALVVAVVIQTIFLVVWLSNLSSNVNNVMATLAEFKTERYTREDARRDRELMEQKMSTQSAASVDYIRRIGDLESRLQQMERTQLLPRK